jgi:putative endonuclease
MLNRRHEGASGEDAAIRALRSEGYRIIERNYRSRFGEIDVIAEDGDCLVFVEVKKRNSESYGPSFSSITGRKKQHIIKSALFYLKAHRCFERRIRFDVVGIDKGAARIMKHAFMVDDDRR